MARAVVYLRFPRNRNGFKDPPIVDWNVEKEKELWNLLKKTTTDLEWSELARHFGVSLVYLLQQAAWLYEKELTALRERMTRISVSLPPAHDNTSSIESKAGLFPNHQSDSQILGLKIMNDHSEFDTEDNFSDPKALSLSKDSSENDHAFAGRRLLTSSRLFSSDNDSDYNESDLDGFLPAEAEENISISSGESVVSQSALEAALMEQSNPSEASQTL